MAIFGSVQITGFIAPTYSGDTYATHDAYYGRDGLRNVDLESDLDSITNLRRKAGMIVGVSGGTKHYRLLPEPWSFTFSDWDVAFLTPSNISSYGVGNRWHVPYGVTVTVPYDFQTFIYGDLYVEGTIDVQTNGQLVVLNGNIIMSGGSIVGSGTTYVIQLPDFDTKVSNLTLSGDVLTVIQNDLSSYSVTLPVFNGGSGNCITDLYVSNIYGCSPITVHNDIVLTSGSRLSGGTSAVDFYNGTGVALTSDNSDYLTPYVWVDNNGSPFAGLFDDIGLHGINVTQNYATMYNSFGSINVYNTNEPSNFLSRELSVYTDSTIIHDTNKISLGVENYIGPGSGDQFDTILITSEQGIGNKTNPRSKRGTIISSRNSYIESGITNSVIIGGDGIVATTHNTAYVDRLNIKNLGVGTSITNLGIDASGNVVSGSTGTNLLANNGLSISGDSVILGGVLLTATTITSTPSNVFRIEDGEGVLLQTRDINSNFKLAEYSPSTYTGSTYVIDCFSSGNLYDNSNVILNFAGSFQTYTNTSNVYNFGTSNVYDTSSDINNWGGSNTILNSTTIFNLGIVNTFTNTNSINVFGNSNNMIDIVNTTIIGRNNYLSGVTYSDKFILGNTNNNLIIDGTTGVITSQPTYSYTGNGDTNVGLLAINSSGEVYNTNVNTSTLNSLSKFTATSGLTGSVTQTFNHGLSTIYISVSVWDNVSGDLIYPQVTRVDSNNVDITVATTGTYDILITG